MIRIDDLTVECANGTALNKLSLLIEGEGIFGILAGRGAGKTTLARAICGICAADAGSIKINDEKMTTGNTSLKKKVRFVPAQLKISDLETVYDYLMFVGSAIGVPSEKKYKQIDQAIELLELVDVKDSCFCTLSADDRCRLSIAASLIGNPAVIVIDCALDHIPESEREDLYELLMMLAAKKEIVLLSSKPAVVKKLCTGVAVMCDGAIALSDKICEIERKINATCQTYVTVRGEYDEFKETILGLDGVVSARLEVKSNKEGLCTVLVEHVHDELIKDRLFKALSEGGVPLLSSKTVTLSLEDVYYSFAAKDEKRFAANKGKGGRA